MSNELRDNETPREIRLRREVEQLREELDRVRDRAAQRCLALEMRNDELVRVLADREMLRPPAPIVVDGWLTDANRPSNSEINYLRCREPTAEEMERALRDAHTNGKDEAFIPPGWTVRRCRHLRRGEICGTPVAGGPTACVACISRRAGDERADQAEQVLRDAVEQGRLGLSVFWNLGSSPSVNPNLYALRAWVEFPHAAVGDVEVTALATECARLAEELARTHPSDSRGLALIKMLTDAGTAWRDLVAIRNQSETEEDTCDT